MITVIFATYNGSDSLPLMLEALTKIIPPQGGWKLVAVDNASTDNSHEILTNYLPKLPLTILSETQQGKNSALNTGLKAIEGDLVVFTDDDIKLTDGVTEALTEFTESDCDVATFICLNEKNELRRKFSPVPFVHNKRSLFAVGTVEVMINVDKIRHSPSRFPVNMGAGQYLSVGDEPVFLARCLNYGCRILYFPIPIVCHPQESSGSELKTNGSLEARGLAVKEVFGRPVGFLALLLFSIK